MSVLRSLLTAGVLASGLLWSLNGITATPAAQASGDRYEVTQQRNPDAACLDCHKPDTEGMHGKHASVINPNNKLPVTCTNCHGQPSPQHREGVKDVSRCTRSESRTASVCPVICRNSCKKRSGRTMSTQPKWRAPAAIPCIHSKIRCRR